MRFLIFRGVYGNFVSMKFVVRSYLMIPHMKRLTCEGAWVRLFASLRVRSFVLPWD